MVSALDKSGSGLEGDYSAPELAERLKRVQQSMTSAHVDALLVYDDGGHIGGGSARYLAGYSQAPPPLPCYYIVPAQGEGLLCFAEGMGRASENFDRVFGANGQTMTFGGNALSPAVGAGLVEALGKAGFSAGRLGVDGLGRMSHPVVTALQAGLTDAEVVDVSRLVEWVRRDKSGRELDNFRVASRLSHRAMEIFQEVVRPGIRQDLAVALATHATEAQGAEELEVIHGCGDPWYWGSGTRGDWTFSDGDLVSCELNARYHGYYSQVCRTWSLGSGSPETEKLVAAVRSASETMLDHVKPGMTGKEVYQVGLDEVRSRGYDWCGVRFGHGLGLTIGEGFDFADWDVAPDGPCSVPLPVGAFGVFHPFLIERGADGRGVRNALWGDPWVLGEHGAELVK